MLLQPTTSKPPLLHPHSSSYSNNHGSFSYSISFPYGFCDSTLLKPISSHKNSVFTCSISKVHSYGTMDYEKRPVLKWNTVYKRISMMENPNLGTSGVLNQWEKEGNRLSKWDLCRIVKHLRKFRRFELALEVYEWMNNREERFRLTSSDTAIQLDLIAKVKGMAYAEEYFLKLPDSQKDKRVYGALLNAYVRARITEKAESLMDKMRVRGYAIQSLPYNVIMTLYMNLKQFDKVESVVSEMMEKRIPLDLYSYNIWISCCGSQGSVEKMEEALEQMKLDTYINPNWTTFSTVATQYIRLGHLEKAEECLKKIESRITGRDRIPYHFLISLYGSVGKKEEALRVWNVYKSIFPSIPNLGYHALISSFIRLDDIEGAENIYHEWVSVKSRYDPRIGNLLLGWYVRQGFSDKAAEFYDKMIKFGGKPNSTTWEILAEGHIKERRITEAFSCLKDAISADGSKNWRPRPTNVSSILELCEQEGDVASKEALMGLLRQAGFLDDERYMSNVSQLFGDEAALAKDRNEDDHDDSADILLNQLQGSL